MRAPAEGQGGTDLVIGIGNPLRGDDGVGWWLARRAQAWGRERGNRPAPTVRLVPQLTPELALEVAAARRVLFLDAWSVGNGEGGAGQNPVPLLRPLRPGEGGEVGVAGGHALEPAALLALAGLLEVKRPPGWLLLVPAFAFPHGAELSADLRAQLPAAEILLAAWLADA
jgi:hydrogenase maturation protease